MSTRLFILAIIFLAFGCSGGKDAKESQVVAEDPEAVNKLVTDYITNHLSDADTSHYLHVDGDSVQAVSLVKKYYAKLGNHSLWSDKGKMNEAGKSLTAVIHDAESFGLIPEDYHTESIDSLFRTAYDSAKGNYSVNRIAQADLLMTDAFFTFCVHVSVGRMANDSAATREWRIGKVAANLPEELDKMLASKDARATFERLEPQRREYQSVKKYMNDYRKQTAGLSWQHLPDRKTDSAAFFAAVRNRLLQTGDLDTTENEKDSIRIAHALKKFQHRYYLEEDGKLGRNTILALDMTPEDWTRQFAMNLERWRWEPATFEKRHMIVNLPVFKMTVWEEDTIVMQSKIVCGAVKTQTPELDSKMNQIILYPYWNVPYSIAWKEILPHVKRDTAYLRKERYDVLDRNNQIVDPKTVNWKKYGKGNLPFKFRQRTGDDNALGIMKFDFPNKYSVYMHDTNAKKYFRTETRAYSHGCMRLEKFMELAHFLIRDDSVKLPRDTFDRWTTLGDQKHIDLRKPLPIHVRYFTCDVDTDGNVFVHCDIYLRDKRMENVLYKNVDAKKDRKPASPAQPAKQDHTTMIDDRQAILRRNKSRV